MTLFRALRFRPDSSGRGQSRCLSRPGRVFDLQESNLALTYDY